jgi:hypothetical protein
VNGPITHENEKGFKHIEEVPRISLVSYLKCLSEDLNHERKKILEGFLDIMIREIKT